MANYQSWARFFLASLLVSTSTVCLAVDLVVSTTAELHSAFQTAGVGDNILLQPGTYAGGIFRENLTGVTVRSVDPANRAVISGGNTNIQLVDSQDVTIEDLIFEDGIFNGLNFDDGGSFATPTTNLTLRNIVVRRAGSTGNQDGIKLSGVVGFLIDRVEVDDWGDGGSAIDMVGSHNGLIQNSWLHTSSFGVSGSGIRPKGGSKNITIRANRIDLPIGDGRAIQAGGSTGSQFFRFIDGDSGYEAKNITAEGNVVLGGSSAFSWVNIDGGEFRHNYIERPGTWTMRILNENSGLPIVDTKNGLFNDNIIRFRDSPSEYNRAVNIGPETEPSTFQFARNQWYNEVTPTSSTPNLPTPEVEGVYGVEPAIDANDAIAWEFDWGSWLVNATDQANTITIGIPNSLSIATPGPTGKFLPNAASPLQGEWSFTPLAGSQVAMTPFSQVILAKCSQPGICNTADFSVDGQVDNDDLVLWQAGFGRSADATHAEGDANGDRDVDGADFLQWQREAFAASAATSLLNPVPEPGTMALLAALILCTQARRSGQTGCLTAE
ncbi:MAG: hypothetical protein GXP24_10845 [Planctomycetes bacterium]|nr:hypothetical protein [Planctomycetota bacterium]